MQTYGHSVALGLGTPACQQDEKVIDDEASRHKYAEAEDTQSLNIEEVNDYVSTSNIVFLNDLASRKSVIIYKGEIVESFEILIGIPTDPTHRGVFTVHGIDYCSPWNGAKEPNKEKKGIPCSFENRLGAIVFWYRGNGRGSVFVYGVHTRHPGDQGEFNFVTSKRMQSEGCVVGPHEILRRFLKNIMLKDPAFLLPLKEGQTKKELHDAVKIISPLLVPTLTPEEIKKFSEKKHNNYFIAIKDFKGRVPFFEANEIPTYIDPPVAIDMKVINIDTRTENIKTPLTPEKMQKYRPLLNLLKPKKKQVTNTDLEKKYTQPKPVFLVTNCLVTKKTPVHITLNSGSVPDQHFALLPGDKLMGVYKHSLNLSSSVFIKYWDRETNEKQEGWIQDLSGLRCNSDVDEDRRTSDSCAQMSGDDYKYKSYWSYKKNATLFKCSKEHQ